MISLRYRADIDGLRAIAVLGVVIYHAFPCALPGGFIGVDIFFVISGYLISGILYKGQWEENFSYGEFYARRIRRLFPALITVLVITMAYGWLILLPDEFQQLGKHVAAGTPFIQNIVFWQESGYFDTAANLKPLLHLWSLAVEEQFYIFFPLLLLLFWKKPKILVPAMLVLLIATFVLNVVMSVQNRASDFFLTPYRAWEFLGGSLLAWWHYDKGHEEEVPAYREVLSWVGLTLLVLGMAFIHTGDPYPGWRALLPVTGTLLLMEGGAGGLKGAWVNRKILSNSGVVWIGLISYPLYLFHWPALSFVHIVKGANPKPAYLVDALIIALLLTVLTYYFIERKIRHNRARWTWLGLVWIFAVVGLTGELINYRRLIPDFNSLMGDSDGRKLEYTKLNNSVFYKQIGGTGKQTLFVGDSNMEMYFPRIHKLVNNNTENSRGAEFIIAHGTPPINGFQSKKFDGCGKLIPEMYKILKIDQRIDRVVIAACWVSYFHNQNKNDIFYYSYCGSNPENSSIRDMAVNELKEIIQGITNQKKQVYLILNTPVGENLNPKEILYKRGFLGVEYSPKLVSAESFNQQYGKLLNQLSNAARDSGAIVIDPLPYLTSKGFIITCDKEGPIRKDGYHLNSRFVLKSIKYLDQTVYD